MTISDIAKMAGVSSAAVSRYFNNGYLSDEKKEAIRRVVEVTGYRPSIQAQMLRTKKTRTIGVMIPKVDSSSMGRILAGIYSVLDDSGYRVLMAVSRNDTRKELEYLTVFDESQVDGIIMSGTIFSATHRKAMKKVNVPLVVVGQQIAGFNCVFHDDYHASYELTRRFLDAGRMNPGYIGVTEKDRAVGEMRYKGYCDAVKDAGLMECRGNYITADFTINSGYEKMGELMAIHPDLDAVVCATDRIAIGAQKWAQEHDFRVPQQLIIGGHGDSDMAALATPPISTIHYHYEESGAVAARRLLELLNEEAANTRGATKEVQLGFELINRV